MIVWILLISYLILLRLIFPNFKSKVNQKYYLILSGTVVALVMGLRYPNYEVVYDLSVYYNFYKTIGVTNWCDIFEVISRFEPGYVILNKLLYTIVPWGQAIFIVEAIFSVFCVTYFIYKNSDEPFLAMMFYVTLGTMIFQLTAFRQSFAIGICILSIEYIKQKKLKKYLICILLAMSFHKSAIIFLLSYFILNKKINRKIILYIIIITIISTPLAKILTQLGNYFLDMEYGQETDISRVGWIINMSIYGIVIVFASKYNKYIKSNISINLVISAMTLYGMRNVTLILERVSFFFSPGLIIAIPCVINVISNYKLRNLIKLVVIILTTILFFYRGRNSDWLDYRFFLQ